VTLGEHVLVGVRKWGVAVVEPEESAEKPPTYYGIIQGLTAKKGDADGPAIVVWTATYEQRHGLLSNMGFWALGGSDDAQKVWEPYFNNLIKSLPPGAKVHWDPAIFRKPNMTTNPWKAEVDKLMEQNK
jgi:hypothetical protein